MQIWLDSPTNDYSGDNIVSRQWRGSSSDVSEIFIENSFDQEDAISLIGLVPWILVRFSDWTMVPLENLIANSRGSGTRIAVAIEDKIELNGAVFSLGGGVDAVLVSSDLVDEAAIMAGERLEFEESENETALPIIEAEVTSVESAGIGERVCIDLTRRLHIGQGIPVGSLSSSLCLVHGETISSDFVPTRPFRVNAGAIHSYVLLPDGTTKYLSELISGDEVAVASESGLQESATIGRLKIENRPLILIRFTADDKQGQIVAQQAETVRLVAPSKEPISVTDLSKGDSISIISDSRMRHVGIAVESKVVEK
ncbi:MAG: 3-dehydroquinate synthase II [Euryarchaeota archaeon]|nr:3-dehydroquinate synthase II [Euryarchaeota archaeon]